MTINYTKELPFHFMVRTEEDRKQTVTKWSNAKTPPAVGQAVTVTMNSLGKGIVKDYFVTDGWLGVRVSLQNPPAWWAKKHLEYAHIFGIELSY